MKDLEQFLYDHADEVFSPEVRQAAKDFVEGRPNPIIDRLRASFEEERRGNP